MLAVKDVIDLPYLSGAEDLANKKLMAVLIDECDKTLSGRNYDSTWNQTIAKLLGDIRRKGVPLLVVNGQATGNGYLDS
jgi:hypothetical protein